MNYIIFDLEWNQPADERSTVQDPVYLNGEIIEIGAVKLDDQFCPMDELRLYITPKYYTRMHQEIAHHFFLKPQVLNLRFIQLKHFLTSSNSSILN